MTAKLNLLLREGATFRRRLKWLDSRKRAVNLTGVSVTLQVRDKPDGQLMLELTALNGRLVIAPLSGQIDIVLAAAETAALGFSRAVWDLRAVMANGDVVYPIEGAFLVTRSVTE